MTVTPAPLQVHGRLDGALEPLLNVQEVADILRVRPRWVYDHVVRGEFPVVGMGRYYRFRPVDVQRYIERHLTAHKGI